MTKGIDPMKPFARIILVLTLVLAAAAEAKLAPPKLEDYTHGDNKIHVTLNDG